MCPINIEYIYFSYIFTHILLLTTETPTTEAPSPGKYVCCKKYVLRVLTCFVYSEKQNTKKRWQQIFESPVFADVEGYIKYDRTGSGKSEQFFRLDDLSNAVTVENCAALCSAIDHCAHFVFRALPAGESPGASCVLKRVNGDFFRNKDNFVLYEKELPEEGAELPMR